MFRNSPEGTVIKGCTEHHKNGCLFRAHPAYRGHNQWYDWALFEWELSEGSTQSAVYIPGQIVLFLDITQAIVDANENNTIGLDKPGLYALIESLEEPLPSLEAGSEIVVLGSKTLTTSQQKKRVRSRQRKFSPNIFLVSVDTIYQPIAAIPNIGGDPGDFVFIRPTNMWPEAFRNYIQICCQ